MTLKPVADGGLPVGAFMGEVRLQSQPMGAIETGSLLGLNSEPQIAIIRNP
jgi:hypothetical protein